MKSFLWSVAFVVVSMSCLAQVVKQASDIYIVNADGQIKLKVIDPTQSTSGLPWIEFGTQTNTVFQIPSTGILPAAYGGTGSSSGGIKSGTVVTAADGTATNTFAAAFTSIPVVVLTQFGAVGAGTNLVTSITTSNFMVRCSAASITNQWIAVGSP